MANMAFSFDEFSSCVIPFYYKGINTLHLLLIHLTTQVLDK